MKLFLITRDEPGWDEADGFVIAAPNNKAARALAATDPGDEGAGTWLDGELSKCVCIGETKRPKARIILRSYRSA